MARPSEILSEIIADLRVKRLAGAAISQLVMGLQQQGLELSEINRHFKDAFRLSGRANLMMMPKLGSGEPNLDIIDEYIGGEVDKTRDQWKDAPAYPDLMRRRDRHAFRQVARLTGNIFVVCAADRVAGQYIGKAGYKPAPCSMLGLPRSSPPNQGLVAADPNAPELLRLLNSIEPAKSYGQYQEDLERLGFRIGSQDDGYIIRDKLGSAFYSDYRLHGVYKQENGSNAWTGRQGEQIREELNRRMCEELVQAGPHDMWAERLELNEANPLRGPLPPVLFFLPDGNVYVRSNAKSMELYYRYLGIAWDEIYPSEPPKDEEAK